MGNPGWVYRPNGSLKFVPDREAYFQQYPFVATATAACIARDEADRARVSAAKLAAKIKNAAGPTSYTAVRGSAFAAASVAAAGGGKGASRIGNGDGNEDGASACCYDDDEMPVCGCLGSGIVPATCASCAGKGLSGSIRADWAQCFACEGKGFVMRSCTNPQCPSRNNNSTPSSSKSTGGGTGGGNGTVSVGGSGARR